MKVRELIERLQECHPDSQVFMDTYTSVYDAPVADIVPGSPNKAGKVYLVEEER